MTISSRVMLLALGVLVLTPIASAAQSPSAVTFGLKGGVNSATVDVSDDSDYGMRWGAVGGLFLGGRITDNVGLQVEGLFSQHGATDKTPGSDVKIRVTYIDVPVLLRFGSTTTNATHFHVFTGPQAGFKVNAEATSKAADLTVDLDDDVENLDFGWTAGVGVERNRVSLDVRYTLGLKNVASDSATSDTAKNRTFTALVGLRLK